MKLKQLLISTLITILLIGCSAQSSQEEDLLATIQAQGYITVATSPDFPPYEFIDSTKTGDDQYVGADIELAKYIADALGVELKLLIADFNTAIASISTQSADIIISGLGYKEERLEAMDFTKTYNPSTDDPNSYQGIMMKADVADQYTTLESMSDLNIGAQLGSLQESYVKEQIPDATITTISDLATGIIMLQNGRIDALAITSTTGSQYIEANPDLKMTAVSFSESFLAEFDGTVIGVQKNQASLLTKLNEIIDEILASGVYDQWELEYTEYAESIGE